MINPVIQEEETGCGIAAAACILGLTYKQMKAVANGMGIQASDPSLWSDTQYVRRLLAWGGAKAALQETPFSSWAALPDLALLSIKHHQEDGVNYWHWVVFRRLEGQPAVLDSAHYLPSNVRYDFAAMHPKWFIGVSPPQCGSV
ncbi:MAG: hypothetical protein VX258_13110 [Pseudomonadota bacterium]|nr:hypothetical protein [Pseudomonadota bacterium]